MRADEIQRQEIIDLVSVLGSMKRKSCVKSTVDSHIKPAKAVVQDTSTQTRGFGRTASVQVSDGYLTRLSDQCLKGEWIPLDSESVRRGCIVRCLTPTLTDTNGLNVRFSTGDLAKVWKITAMAISSLLH